MTRGQAQASAASPRRDFPALACVSVALALALCAASAQAGEHVLTGPAADAAAKKRCKKAKKGAMAAKKGKCRKQKQKPAAPGPGAGPAAQLAVSPSAKDFGSHPAGTDSAPTTFTVTNTGNVASGTPAPSLSGPAADQFGIVATTCTAALAPSQTCTVGARFSPETAGEKYALLNVTAAGGAAATAALTGRTPTGAQLSITPAPYDFGPAVVGIPLDRFFTVSNVGVAPSSALAVTTSGAFLATDGTCPGTTALAVAATCSLTVTFTPPAAGPWSGILRVSATAGGVAESQLSGQGI